MCYNIMATWDGYNNNIPANRFGNVYMKEFMDISGILFIRRDASLNRLFVQNDATFMNNLYAGDIITANLKVISNGDASLNRLFVRTDVSFMSNLYVNNTLTLNGNLITNGNVFLNGNVFFSKDISYNGNINIGKDLIVQGNIAVKNYTTSNIINTTTTNYRLAIIEDISLNGKLYISSDTSLNGNLFVSKDISFNGNLNVNTIRFLKDISVNGMNIGRGAGNFITNTAIGYNAIASNTVNGNITAIGYQSLALNTTGTNNTAVGYQSLASNTTGSNNTAIGYRSLASNTTGSNNTAMGYLAGISNTTGSYNTYIGANADTSGQYSYSTAIGQQALITGNNQIVIGSSSESFEIVSTERYLNTVPIVMRAASNTQLVDRTIDTIVLFPTILYPSANDYSGISYLNGVFTNTNSYAVGIMVDVSVAIDGGSTNSRRVWISSSDYGTVSASTQKYGNPGLGSNQYSLCTSAIFPFYPGSSFSVYVWHNSAEANLLLLYTAGQRTIITITVF